MIDTVLDIGARKQFGCGTYVYYAPNTTKIGAPAIGRSHHVRTSLYPTELQNCRGLVGSAVQTTAQTKWRAPRAGRR